MEFPGALYHVTSRGDRREPIYEDDADREQFLATLAEVVGRYNWLCHAYCLMTNHYHLIVETVEGNLSRGMRQLNGVFTQSSNRRHGRQGHLLQGRFKGILVDKDSYLLELEAAAFGSLQTHVGMLASALGPDCAKTTGVPEQRVRNLGAAQTPLLPPRGGCLSGPGR